MYKGIYIWLYTDTNSERNGYTQIYIHRGICIETYRQTHIHTHKHVCIQIYRYSQCLHIDTKTHKYTWMQRDMYIYKCTYRGSHMHIQTHV